MAKADILSVLYSKNKSALEFRFDMLTAPPLLSLVSVDDINELYRIATSVSLASKIKQKYKMIDDVMIRRGFKKLHAGTNRVIYRHLEIPTIVAKIAVDEVGINDNPDEFVNQAYLQPYVTKVFEVAPNGVIGIFERVQAISSREEFVHIAPDIFDFINTKLIGEYVVDDIGTKFFMNWGIREGFGPVLLDFPYVYKLDGNKIFCNHHTYGKTDFCGGVIDYDIGFNHLVCEKCGKKYQAKMLKQDAEELIINKSKGDVMDMKIKVVRGREVITEVNNEAMDYIAKPKVKLPKGNSFIKVHVELPTENEQFKAVFEEKQPEVVEEMPKVSVKPKLPEKDIKIEEVGFAKVVYGEEEENNTVVKSIEPQAVEKAEPTETVEEVEAEPVTEVVEEQISLEDIKDGYVEGLAEKLNDAFTSPKNDDDLQDYAELLAKYNIDEKEFEETEEVEEVEEEEDDEEYEEFQPVKPAIYKSDVDSQY